jgi:uncharacterized protein (TIGR02246 family)
MFERYTEKARRVIFFARYEASQYGSHSIESEHLLLGVLREDRALATRFLGPSSAMVEIRSEIEKQIPRGERISTSVEVPLSEECAKILKLAGEEAERLGNRHIGTEHLMVAMLGVEKSLAARVLRARGLTAAGVREQLGAAAAAATVKAPPRADALVTLDSFLAGLKWYNWEQLAPFFAEKAQFVDAMGKRWKGRAEIEKQFEALFAPYAKKNVTFVLEDIDVCGIDSLVAASVLWENVTVGGESTRSLHRMTVILASQGEEWAISLVQVTPVVR